MKKEEQAQFISPSRGPITLDGLVYDIIDFMRGNPDDRYVVGVGTDSKLYSDHCLFVNAIFVHRVGHGGRYYYRKIYKTTHYVLRTRIHEEAWMSLELATKLLEMMQSALSQTSFNYNLEIHVDIGERGKTRSIIKEIVGMIQGSGFLVRIKPDAVCATTVADKHT